MNCCHTEDYIIDGCDFPNEFPIDIKSVTYNPALGTNVIYVRKSSDWVHDCCIPLINTNEHVKRICSNLQFRFGTTFLTATYFHNCIYDGSILHPASVKEVKIAECHGYTNMTRNTFAGVNTLSLEVRNIENWDRNIFTGIKKLNISKLSDASAKILASEFDLTTITTLVIFSSYLFNSNHERIIMNLPELPKLRSLKISEYDDVFLTGTYKALTNICFVGNMHISDHSCLIKYRELLYKKTLTFSRSSIGNDKRIKIKKDIIEELIRELEEENSRKTPVKSAQTATGPNIVG
jgi:hypothetical protein